MWCLSWLVSELYHFNIFCSGLFQGLSSQTGRRSWWFGKDPSLYRYINAFLKICQYFCLHMKIICWRFHIKTCFTLWDIRTWDMGKVYLQTFRTNNLAYFLRHLQTARANNSRILRIKNAKFSGYCFYVKGTLMQIWKSPHIFKFI